MVFLVTVTMVVAAAAASLVLASVTSERGKGRQTTTKLRQTTTDGPSLRLPAGRAHF